jgi:choline/glycine/proline betaine transport protein
MSETRRDPTPSSRDPNAEPAARYRGGPTPLRTVSFGPFEMHPWVFPGAAAIILSMVVLTMITPDAVGGAFESMQAWIVETFGWLYILSMSAFLLFALWLGFGRFGHVKLGKDTDTPEFGRLAWFAMLFSAGMGIGLVFWSVAEPVYHFTNPPEARGNDLDAARTAMALTIFHWGLHPWGLYAVVSVALAYFGYRRGHALSFRSVFYPLIGERVNGRVGDLIDILAVVATLFGVATSLGLGAMQVNAGLNALLGVSISVPVQITLIAGITAVATISVVAGLDAGIRRLSELNMAIAACLLLFVVLAGSTLFFFNSLVENIGAYLQRLPFNSFWTGTFEEEAGREWLGSWTVFYWGWWIAWSPFVGMFIARVSRGRTFREFITGVLLVPTAVGIVWLTAFGSSALHQATHPDQASTPGTTYPVAVTTAEGLTDADGDAVVGPNGGALTRTETGALLGPEGRALEVNHTEHGPELVVAETGEPFEPTPEQVYDGKLAAEEKSLTVPEYITEPVLNESRTATIDRVATVLFVLLESYPLKWVTWTLATLCIILFFVTSSDSASMVIDIIASGGNPDPPVGTRLFWAITEGLVAAALLLAGGLNALQTASITAALPFCVVLILMCVSLTTALVRHESARADDR